MENVSATVFRYDPTMEKAARYETYEVPHERGMRVLDVLKHIQENYDNSFVFRYSCRRRRCGSCSVLVNGKPELACIAEAKKKMIIEPSPNLPIIRDLVVDTQEYEHRVENIRPYLMRKAPPAQEPEKLFPRDFGTVRPLNQCIECFSCMSACPVNGIRWGGFDGPTTLVQIARRQFDPRDSEFRLGDAASAGLEHCVTCYSCVNTCPVEIGILEGVIEKLRKKAVEQKDRQYAKYNETWKELIVANGVVNPFLLMRRVSKIQDLFQNVVKGAQFFFKGKISLGSKRVSNVQEIQKIHEKIGGAK